MSALVELLKVLSVIALSRHNRGGRDANGSKRLTGFAGLFEDSCVLCLIGRFMTVAAGAKSNNKTVSNVSGASFLLPVEIFPLEFSGVLVLNLSRPPTGGRCRTPLI